MNKLFITILYFFIITQYLISFDYNKVELTKISDNFYIHTTYKEYYNKPFGANGLIFFSQNDAVIIDTPWNDNQTEILIKKIKSRFNKNIKLVIISHHHIDNLGGINYLKKAGIKAICTPLTKELAKKNNFIINYPIIDKDIWSIMINNEKIEVYYPGPAHTIDNIVVWFPEYNILFGGCMIKSIDFNSLGNLKDADLDKWPNSLNNIINRYNNIKVVIPGHGKHDDKKLILHTLNLLNKNEN